MPYQKYFGIDFGTTCSGVSVFETNDNGELTQSTAFHCGNERGEPDSSFVAINRETNEIKCGYSAWKVRNKLAVDHILIPSVKMELRTDKDIIPNTSLTIGDVATELFRHIKTLAKEQNCDLDEAVVAIPVGYPAEARCAVRMAAEDAGITIKQFVSEPTAAYMANRKVLAGYSNVLVFDWGGGTLDISILHVSRGIISELATGGMTKAGNDINKILAERIHSKLVEEKGIPLSMDDMPPELKDEMQNRAEKLKKDFSDRDDAKCQIRRYGEFGVVNLTFNYEHWFCPVMRPIIKEAIQCVRQAIDESGLSLESIDKVLMVGGSSNLRPIITEMETLFGEDKVVKPESMAWSISDGAAYLAYKKGEYISNQNVGIKLSDGTTYNFLHVGDPILGFEKKQNFGITDTTCQMRLVFTGSKDIDNSGDKYKTLNLKSTFGFLDEGIIVTARIDPNMVLTVHADSDLVKQNENADWQYDQLKCSFKLPED